MQGLSTFIRGAFADTSLTIDDGSLSAWAQNLRSGLLLICLALALSRRLNQKQKTLPIGDKKWLPSSVSCVARPVEKPIVTTLEGTVRRSSDSAPDLPSMFSCFSCCCMTRPEGGRAARTQRTYVTESLPDDDEEWSSMDAARPQAWTIEDIVEAGVPSANAESVLQLASAIGASNVEPLSDATTLWRFASAREFDIEAAKDMHVGAVAWRASFSITSVMDAHGCGEAYRDDGCRATGSRPSAWAWARGTSTREAEIVHRHGFWGRLSVCAPADRAPVAVWRPGMADVRGYVSEGLLGVMTRGFVAHLEDLLQAGRAQSRRSRKIVRCRLVIDATGLSLSTLRHLPAMMSMTGLGKQYFPEVTASVTVVRAPRSFTFVYNAIEPFLTPVMKRKVCILGENFDEGLRSHAGLERCCLPTFLGGLTPDSEVCAAAPVPQGLGREVTLGGAGPGGA